MNDMDNKTTTNIARNGLNLIPFDNIRKNLRDRLFNKDNYDDDWLQGIFSRDQDKDYKINDEVLCINDDNDNSIWVIKAIDLKTNRYNIEKKDDSNETNNVDIKVIYKRIKYQFDLSKVNKVLSATLYIFFAQAIPAITFASLASEKTNNSIGVTEVLFSMGVGGFLFAILAGQPLVIVGVTGPICIFVISVWSWAQKIGVNFFGFFFWVCFWSNITMLILAIFNFSEFFEKTVTLFSCESFGFLVGLIYIYEGLLIFSSLFTNYSIDSALLSLLLGLGCLYVGNLAVGARNWRNSNVLLRNFISDYGTVLVIIVFTGMQYLSSFQAVSVPKLTIPKTFQPSIDRPWIDFNSWSSVGPTDVLVAIPIGMLLAILLYFDHNVSSALSQSLEFKLKKPSSYDWDFFLLGMSVLLSGILGIVPNYGLLPQSPLHVRSLATITVEENSGSTSEIVKDVIETRWSALLQSVLMFVLLTNPFLHLISLIPLGVIAGVFCFLGIEGLKGNGLSERIYYIFTDKTSRYIEERKSLKTKMMKNIQRYEDKMNLQYNYNEKVILLVSKKVEEYLDKIKEETFDIDAIKSILDNMDDKIDNLLCLDIDEANKLYERLFCQSDQEHAVHDENKEAINKDYLYIINKIFLDFENTFFNEFQKHHIDLNNRNCRQESDSSTKLSHIILMPHHHINEPITMNSVSKAIIEEYNEIRHNQEGKLTPGLENSLEIRRKINRLENKIKFLNSMGRRKSDYQNIRNLRGDDTKRIKRYFKSARLYLEMSMYDNANDIKKTRKKFEKDVDHILDNPDKKEWQRLDFHLVKKYTLIQFKITTMLFGITQSSISVIFPAFIMALVPLRLYILPRLLAMKSIRDICNLFNLNCAVENEFLNSIDDSLLQ